MSRATASVRCVRAFFALFFLFSPFGGFPAFAEEVSGAVPDISARYVAAREKALDWLRAQMVPNGTVPDPVAGRGGLVLGYRLDPASRAYPHLAGRSMVYDNALAVIAFSLAGDFPSASRVLDALVALPRGGALWFSYATDADWPSTTDDYGAVERTGASAWAGFAALLYMRERRRSDLDFGESDERYRSYREFARSLADHILSLQIDDGRDPRHGLVTGGLNRYIPNYEIEDADAFVPGPIEWASAEHNIDAYFFLDALAGETGDGRYRDAASRIAASLDRLWMGAAGQYAQGAGPAGVDESLALDCASWGSYFSLARGREDRARASLAAIEKKYGVRDANPLSPGSFVSGYRPYAPVHSGSRPAAEAARNPRGVWSEGSLGVALAYALAGDYGKAHAIIGEILAMQDGDGGVLYFTNDRFLDFIARPSVAGTAWLALVLSYMGY